MKKYISIIMFGLSFSTIQAQNVNDAFRLGQNNLNGTARFAAMSGAFSALGGDLSAVSLNPAGSVIFANNQATVSLGNFNTLNQSDYFGSRNEKTNNSLDINQAGAVFVFDNHDYKSDWKKFAVAINYENGLLSNKTFAAGVNRTNSIDKYFLYYANGIQRRDIDASYYYFDELNFREQQAYLGYNSYIIEANSAAPTEIGYYTNVSSNPTGNYAQQNAVTSKGYNGKLTFNAAAQYQDWLSIGLSLNSHFTDFRQNQSFTESNGNNKFSTGSTVNYINFNNEIYTYGTGFSFQTGAILKPSKEVRLGFAYESPTWYHLNDEFTQSVYTKGFGLSATPNPAVYGSKTTDPKVINVYDPYTLRTPSKLTGSFAYIYKKSGLFSIDYAVKDYSKMEFGPNYQFNDPTKNNTNNDIKAVLNSAKEIRVGAEIKIKQWSIRGGGRYEESPYINKDIVGDLKGLSGGLGYNWGATKLDFSYSRAERSSQQSFFNQGLLDRATTNSVFNNFIVTMSFEL
jgi:long-subunit fatty acid transport protein